MFQRERERENKICMDYFPTQLKFRLFNGYLRNCDLPEVRSCKVGEPARLFPAEKRNFFNAETYLLLTCSQCLPTNAPDQQKDACFLHCPDWALKSMRTMVYI